MRVIAGKARNIPLLALPGMEITRPTLDRVKEAVFGAIQFEIPGAYFLDLFAGSGAMGIEALSRGAKQAVFVDQNKKAASIIARNLEKTKLTDKAKVLCGDFRMFSLIGRSFDFIYLDPPYQAGLYQDAIDWIGANRLLEKNGKIILEHDGELQLSGIHVFRQKKYGRTHIIFATLAQGEDA